MRIGYIEDDAVDSRHAATALVFTTVSAQAMHLQEFIPFPTPEELLATIEDGTVDLGAFPLCKARGGIIKSTRVALAGKSYRIFQTLAVPGGYFGETVDDSSILYILIERADRRDW